MDKLTSNSAILRSEVKGQVEFDLLVAVCRANGFPLSSQKEVNFDVYKRKYLGLRYSEPFLLDKDLINDSNELLSFEDAVFSLAEPEWTHIWQGNTSKHFFYGNREDIRFNISISKTASAFYINKYTIIATREFALIEPPKTKFAVGDVIKHKHNKVEYTEYTVLYIDKKSAAVEYLCGEGRHFIESNQFFNYEKVIPLRNQVISLVKHVDPSSYFEHIADAILARFNVTEKS